ncbi:GFA family protein [Sphingomonas swuensis]|uniref:GFA family protein n=1 Tax=Sphingomonas swuensis TaxID=977800 RepID=A0ABP7TC78_9SPHN
MTELVATCHCGRATLRLAGRPEYVSQCNCSLCAKTGFRGIYYPSGKVAITGEFDSYVREDIGEPFLRNLRCRTCGVATHWEPLTPPPHERMGINARLIDPALLKDIEVRDVDGASW